MVVFRLAISFNNSTQFWAENESRPDVGSSKNNKAGSVMISMPTDTRLRCPPEIPNQRAQPLANNKSNDDVYWKVTYKNL